MDLDKTNRWLTLIANIGVVIGLFALIFELRHSSQVAEVAAYQTRIAEIQGMSLELALSSELSIVLEKYESKGIDALTPEERRRVGAWYQVILRQMQGQYYQYQNGFLERAVIDRTLLDISNGIYQSWEQLGLLTSIEIEEWHDEIENIMASKGNET